MIEATCRHFVEARPAYTNSSVCLLSLEDQFNPTEDIDTCNLLFESPWHGRKCLFSEVSITVKSNRLNIHVASCMNSVRKSLVGM